MTQPFVGHDYIDSWLHRRDAYRLLAPWEMAEFRWSVLLHEQQGGGASPSPTNDPAPGRDLFGYGALNCRTCNRTLLQGEVYADGYADGPTLCHACKKRRNGQLTKEMGYAD